jgi:hypothetical protein
MKQRIPAFAGMTGCWEKLHTALNTESADRKVSEHPGSVKLQGFDLVKMTNPY